MLVYLPIFIDSIRNIFVIRSLNIIIIIIVFHIYEQNKIDNESDYIRRLVDQQKARHATYNNFSFRAIQTNHTLYFVYFTFSVL